MDNDAAQTPPPHPNDETAAITPEGLRPQAQPADAENGKRNTEHETRDFAGYRIQSELGRGGMGVVYKAFDPKLKRTVALKVLLSAEHASEEEIQRFFREAESAAKLQHPNIVPVHDLEVFEGKHFYTMDYVDGEPLDSLIEARSLDIKGIATLIEKVARGLEQAHANGIVHRDLKPANIIIAPGGEPRITDFGLAKVIEGGDEDMTVAGLTGSGVAMGTPYYESPEQAAGKSDEVDGRTDVYAMGCILYEMLAGIPPFVAGSAMEIMRMQVEEDPASISSRGIKVAPDIETICLKCLEKDPVRRYQSAAELADDLKRFREDLPVVARRASVLYVTKKRLLRHKVLVSVVAIAALALVGLGTWSYVRIFRERNNARDQLAARLKLEKEKQERLDEVTRAADDAVKTGRKHLAGASKAGDVDAREQALLAAQAAFRKALFLVSGDPEAEKGMREASLAHFEIALASKNWRQAREKLKGARQVGLEQKAFEKHDARIKAAESAREKHIKERVKYLMADAQEVKRKVPHEMARSELVSLRDPATVKLLRPYIGHQHQLCRTLAMNSLAWMGDPSVAGDILPYIHKKAPDGSINPPGVQEAAAKAICILASGDNKMFEAVSRRIEAEDDTYNSFFFMKISSAYRRFGEKAAPRLKASAAITSMKQMQALYRKGLQYHAAGRHDKAIEIFTAAIKFKKDDPAPYLARGVSRHEKGDLDGAISDLTKAIEIDPKDSKAYVNRGYVKRDKGDSKGALADLNKAVELDPRNAAAFSNRGNMKRELGDQEGAIRDYNRAIELDPGDRRYHGNRGISKYRMGDHEEAIKDFNFALKRMSDPYLYLNRGTAYRAMGKISAAMSDYDKAIELSPRLGMAYANRAILKRITGDYKGALADYDSAVKLDPKNMLFWVGKAIIHNMLGDKDGYSRAVREAQKHTPDPRRANMTAYAGATAALAEKNGRELEGKTPKTDKDFMARARYRLRIGRYADAMSDYEETIKLRPRMKATLLYGMARHAGSRRKWKDRMGYLRRATDAASGHPVYVAAYARELLNCKDKTLRDSKKALELAEKAAARRSASASTLDTLAQAQFGNGKLAEAVKTQEKAVSKLSPRYPESYRKRYEDRLKKYREALAEPKTLTD